MVLILLYVWAFVTAFASAQIASSSGYVGYNLTLQGDDDSVIFSTDETRPGAGLSDADVYLNASVHVGTIDLEVDNLSAKINIDAQVLNLLSFNAGVDLSIDQVRLLIQDVNAKVLLEARLENLVRMISTTLDSIDLNPIIATVGEDVGEALNATADGVSSSSSSLSERSLAYGLEHNVLYSTNNYRANKHTNRVLEQTGDIVDHYLDNDGNLQGQQVVGSYEDMTFTGYVATVEYNGEEVTERQYVYTPYQGLSTVSAIYFGIGGNVVGTQVIAESSAGGTSTISEDL